MSDIEGNREHNMLSSYDWNWTKKCYTFSPWLVCICIDQGGKMSLKPWFKPVLVLEKTNTICLWVKINYEYLKSLPIKSQGHQWNDFRSNIKHLSNLVAKELWTQHYSDPCPHVVSPIHSILSTRSILSREASYSWFVLLFKFSFQDMPVFIILYYVKIRIATVL